MKHLARLFLWMAGWKTEGRLPDIDKAVMIIAPHTSMWDFVFGRMASWAHGFEARFMIKSEMFKFPLSIFIRSLGGVPVDRISGLGTFKGAVELIRDTPKIVLIVTPEGTRKKVDDWKKGFHVIARRAGVPVVLGCLDYKEKTAIIGPMFYPGDDYEADKQILNDFYRNRHGKHPERFHL